MKFTKQSSNHILSHLYEHLFFIHLDTTLREKDLYPIIDYSIDAYTTDGRVVFDIETYRDIDIEECIAQANREFLTIKELTDIAIAQLEAEYACSIAIKDMQALEEDLTKLNETPWNTDSTVQIPNDIISKAGEVPLYILTLTAAFNNLPAKIRPLHRLIAGVTVDVAVSDIADTFGGFVRSKTFTTNAQKDLIGEVQLKESVPRAELTMLIGETKHELQSSGAYERLVADLSDTKTMMHAPSQKRTFEDTGITMDDNKWKELATNENLKSITDQLVLEINIS